MLSYLLLGLLAIEFAGYVLLGVVLHALTGLAVGWLVLLAAALAIIGRSNYVFWCYWLGARLARQSVLWADLPPAGCARLLAGEVLAFTLTHSVWQPLLPLLRPLLPRGGPDIEGTPVLFVHGYCCNEGFWVSMRRRLYREGVRNQHGISLEPIFGGIDELADRLAECIAVVCRQTGRERVIVVAHSMGGLVTRAYLQRHGASRLAHVVTVGTPHGGTAMARVGLGLNARQMRLGSEWLRRLDAPTDAVPFTAIYSRHDELVAPPNNATLAGARNHGLDGLGHLALGRAAAVREIILAIVRSG